MKQIKVPNFTCCPHQILNQPIPLHPQHLPVFRLRFAQWNTVVKYFRPQRLHCRVWTNISAATRLRRSYIHALRQFEGVWTNWPVNEQQNNICYENLMQRPPWNPDLELLLVERLILHVISVEIHVSSCQVGSLDDDQGICFQAYCILT